MPSTRRRRPLRLALVVAGVLAGVVAAVLTGLHTPPARDYILGRVSQMLADQGIDAKARALDFNLLSFSLRLEDVTVSGKGLPHAPPLAEIAQASVNLSLTDLIAGRYVVQDGTLVRPRVHLLIDEEGRSNLPELAAREEKRATSETVIDYLVAHFAVTDGRVRYEDRRQQLDLVLPVSSITVAGQRGATSLASHRLQLAAGGGEIALHGRRAPIERVAVDLTYDGERVNVQHLDLTAAGSTLSLAGSAVDLQDPRYDVSMQARLDVTRLATFAGIAGTQAGEGLVGGLLHTEMPNTWTRVATRRLSSWTTAPSRATIGTTARKLAVAFGSAISSSASAARKNVGDDTSRSVAPSRPSAISRRLSRTDAPTSNAPASTATATATPSTTAALTAR